MPPPRFHAPTDAPFGSGSFVTAPAAQRSRGSLYLGLVVLAAAAVGGGYWLWSGNRVGRIELATTPADATVLIDNVKVGDHTPLSISRPPGPYTLSVTREGYVRNDQTIDLQAGQPKTVAVTLEPSPDTGFELTSEPPGGLVWLDGAPINGASGQQARTDFRAFRIPPGHHVLEIKGEARFKPWRQDVEIDPGAIRKIHALLIPAAGGPSPGGKSPSGGAPVGGREVAQAGAPPPPQPLAAASEVKHHASSGGSGSGSGSGATTASGSGAGSSTASTLPTSGGASGPVASAGGGHKRRPREAAPTDDGATDDGPQTTKLADASGDCSITVNSVPWSEVWIDGKNTTKHTPFVDYKVPCGKHKLAFKRSDMQIDHSENITVRAGQPFKQRYTLETDE